MRVTIHQPEHLPWLGLLSKISAADTWIVLDNVPFRKNYFQNRNQILVDGDRAWLTVPVSHSSGTLFRDVRIADDPRWRRRYLGRLAQSLPDSYASGALARVVEIVDGAKPGDSLLEMNLALIEWMCSEFGVTTPVLMSSDLGANGHKSELIRNLCLTVEAEVYIAGPSGRDYLRREEFDSRSIDVRFFNYRHPEYHQGGDGSFVSHLSAIDAWDKLRLTSRDQLHELLTPWDLDPW